MLIVNLIGGLGNQMFQYAFGRSLSAGRSIPVAFDITELLDRSPKTDFTYREYELHIFAGQPRIASPSDLRPFAHQPTSLFDRAFRKVLRKATDSQRYQEAAYFVYEPNVWQTSPNTYFDGYWQNEKYFHPHEVLIRQDFMFQAPPQGKNEELARLICGTNSIGVHVRRGDYVNNQQINGVHGACSPAYYQEAVCLIASQVPDAQLYVFSDEPEWVKQHLHFEYPVTYVSHNTGKNSFEDMRLMSLCQHNIIANSSFSWWGAWLNSNPAKIIVAPRQWMQLDSVDSTDLTPATWIRL